VSAGDGDVGLAVCPVFFEEGEIVKYLIVGHGDGNDGARVIVCETQEQRELQTIEEIYGENTFAGPSECPDIIVLRELKIVTFEGDPPLEWIDAADIVDAERDQLKAELAQAQLMPGAWRCKQCGFTLQKNVLHTMDGTVSADSSPLNEKCPNDGALMAPLTWRETNEDLYKIACERLAENTTLRAHNAALLEACEATAIYFSQRNLGVPAQILEASIRAAIALEKGEK